MAEIPSTLTQIATELSRRLITWTCTPTDLIASGYEVPRWNGLRVIRMDVREEFRPAAHPATGMFTQEYGACAMVERQSGGALLWDEMGYSSAEYLGPWGVCHFLCDLNAADGILRAIADQPLVSDDTRERVRQDLLALAPRS